MKVSEAAERLGVTQARAYQLITEGRLRVLRHNGQQREAGRFSSATQIVLDKRSVEREARRRGLKKR